MTLPPERHSRADAYRGVAMDERVTAPTVSAPTVRGIPRSVLVVGAVLLGLIVVAIAIALAAPVRPAVYAPGTPEAAFQEYYEAWEARDLDTAYGILSSDIRAELTAAEYRRMDSEMSWARSEDRRVVLLGAAIIGERAILDLRIDQFSSGPFGGDRTSWERSVSLVREDGAWHIDEGLLGVETVYYPAKY
jgi:hypothetical protein